MNTFSGRCVRWRSGIRKCIQEKSAFRVAWGLRNPSRKLIFWMTRPQANRPPLAGLAEIHQTPIPPTGPSRRPKAPNSSMSIQTRSDRRNAAIIAHVDHGKTTLVDAMLRQTGIFEERAELGAKLAAKGDPRPERRRPRCWSTSAFCTPLRGKARPCRRDVAGGRRLRRRVGGEIVTACIIGGCD